MRRYSNDQGRRYTELFSEFVLKGHLNRLEVPPMQEEYRRRIFVSEGERPLFFKNPQPVEALGSLHEHYASK